MREKRIYLQCDRCKKEVTLRPQPVTVVEGPYGRTVDSFEQAPEGWENINGKDFCPDCAKKYHNMMDNFYGK